MQRRPYSTRTAGMNRRPIVPAPAPKTAPFELLLRSRGTSPRRARPIFLSPHIWLDVSGRPCTFYGFTCSFINADMLLYLPPETLLHILSFLDLPDLTCLSRAYPELLSLAEDPLLHRERLRTITPSRVSHSLFALSPAGLPLRPTVADLVHRGIMRGMGIERRWRAGLYYSSPHMVKQYETSRRLQWTHARDVLLNTLRARSPGTQETFYRTRVLPREASAAPAPAVSARLVSTVRRLRWALERDRLARFVRDRSAVVGQGGVVAWFERTGRGALWREDERVRLAVCPGIKGIVKYYEGLTR
ncbi:hypothetical protein BC628DRAFT_1171443 [Trametes gibbosa]|nr:hypothetical protein BC628DRAFT_1171443 [Trametes gibbosa]